MSIIKSENYYFVVLFIIKLVRIFILSQTFISISYATNNLINNHPTIQLMNEGLLEISTLIFTNIEYFKDIAINCNNLSLVCQTSFWTKLILWFILVYKDIS